MDNNVTSQDFLPEGEMVILTKAREAVGLFTDEHKLQDAVRELETTAFPRDSITVLGTQKEIEEKFGSGSVDPLIAEDDPDSPRQPPIRPEEKTIGTSALIGCATYIGAVSAALIATPVTIPGTLAAVVLGGGGGAALGTTLAKLLGHHFDKNIEHQVEKGGLLLWVRTPDPDLEYIACNILLRHGATHVKVHDITP